LLVSKRRTLRDQRKALLKYIPHNPALINIQSYRDVEPFKKVFAKKLSKHEGPNNILVGMGME
jgi:hypothetical protein